MSQRSIQLYVLLLLALALACAAQTALAQTASFNYQGRLSDSGNPANANYDLQFKLYDALTGGAQIGVRTRTAVPVTGGIFTVQLDFAVGAFSGADRFLEIGVRAAGSPDPFTTLSPRQPITSAPYAFHSQSSDAAATATTATNANQLGGVDASQYVLTTDSRMTDARSPAPGSTSYIQNTAIPQAASNFNISGNGTAGGTLSAASINAATQYNIGGNRVLSVAGGSNVFGGVGAGAVNTGTRNAFFGSLAGSSNITATDNAFFGSSAGQSNTAGFNAFFGSQAGLENTTGGANAFFGASAGMNNTTGSSNSFFGRLAGNANMDGLNNSFFGSLAGQNNTGSQNTFVGYAAGYSNTTTSDNSFFGASAGRFNTDGTRNSFFGVDAGRATTTDSDSSFFGYQAGQNSNSSFDTSSENSFFGSQAGKANTTGLGNSFFGYQAGYNSIDGYYNSFFGDGAGNHSTGGQGDTFIGVGAGNLNTTGSNNAFLGYLSGQANTSGSDNAFLGEHAGYTNTTGDNNTIIGASANVGANNLDHATALGAGAVVSTSSTVVIGRSSDFVRIPGFLTIPNLAAAGSTQLCRNSNDRVGDCSSSLRYKTNLAPYRNGFDIVNRLRPISFTWKDGGMRDLGFGAEDVEKIDPLLVTYNKQGQVEGVKYDRISVILVNAIKEQQQQIAAQQEQIQDLKSIKGENAELKAQLAALLVRLEHVERKRAR